MNQVILESPQRRRVVVIGPGPSQVGGVATFLNILFSSPELQEKYEFIHLDTTRGSHGAGLASRFAFINIAYFLRQSVKFVEIALRQKPEVVHLPLTSFWAYWKDAAFILMARVFGIKVVAHLHGGVFDRYYRESPSMLQRLIGWVMQQADVIIALSDWWKIFLLDEICPDLHVEVVQNSVDLMFAQAICTANNHQNRDKNLIIFVGGLGRRKGVYDILKAIPLVVKRWPEAHFSFAGSEETKGEKGRIEQMCADYSLQGVVNFLGTVIGQEKLNLFQSASIFLLPSYGENLPFALLEAMAAGLPVITTPVGAIPEIVSDGYNGFLIQPGDIQSLVNRIVELLENTQLRSAMSKCNVERIKMEYMPEIATAKIDRIYTCLFNAAGS